MKMLKRVIGLSLSGAIAAAALTGCGQSSVPEPTATIDPSDMAYQVTGLTRNTTLFTVNGREVPVEEYLFWLMQAITEQQQYNYYLLTDESWDGQIEGTPSKEYLKNDALETSKLYAVIQNKADEAGLSVTEEDYAEMDADQAEAEAQLNMYGSSFQEYLDSQCISEEGFRRLNGVAYLVADLMDSMGDELAPDDAKMEAFLDEVGYYNVKHILLSTRHANEDGTYTDYTDEEKAAVLTEAQGYVSELRALPADQVEARFDEIMNERSDDTRNAETGELYYPDGYLTLSGQMVAEFEEAALGLELGEVSDPVETLYGYHIILRLDADTEDTRSVYPDWALSKQLEEWTAAAEVEVTPEYDALDPKAVYDKLNEILDARQAEKEAEAAATATPAPEGSAAPAESQAPAPESTSASAPEESPAA